MANIKIRAIDQNISFIDSPRIYSGDIGTDFIHFEFDEVWNGFIKTAVFYREVAKPYFQVLKNDECVIPHEVLKTAGKFYVGVVGTLDNKVLTSEVIGYEIGQGATTPIGEIVPEPSEEIWQQILGELASIRELAQNMTSDQEEFKQQITQDNNQFKQQITQDNTSFKENMSSSFNEYVESANTNIEGFKTQATQDLTQFKDRIETDNTIFKTETKTDFDEYYQSLIEARLPKQLLINNDFQINQRGQSEYIGNGYSVDMWKCTGDKTNNCKLGVVDNGITIQNINAGRLFLSQYVEHDNSCIGKKYTLSLVIGGVHHEITMMMATTQDYVKIGNTALFGKFNYDSSKKRISVGFYTDSTSPINIEYIDLFEGDIAYPHVKKKYQDDLMECKRYLYVGSANYYRYITSEGFDYFQSPFLESVMRNMASDNRIGMLLKDTCSLAFVGTVAIHRPNEVSKHELILISHLLNTKDSKLCAAQVQVSCEPL